MELYVLFSNINENIFLKGVASLRDHIIARLQDSTLLTSHDVRYIQFAFDVLLNADLNRNSALVACHIGLETIFRESARFSPDTDERILKFDEPDDAEK